MQRRTLADLKTRFDRKANIEVRLTAALKELAGSGAENWETEIELCRRAKVSPVDIGRFREVFKQHVVACSESTRRAKHLWFGNPKAAAEARKILSRSSE